MIKEENINCTVEALILASVDPVSVKRLGEATGNISPARIREAVADLNNVYMGCGNSFRIREVAGGYQMYILPDFEQAIRRLLIKERTVRLTRAALETLAIIAYKQPVTKIDIEHIRGVASDGVIHNLLQRKLVLIAGRADTPGRPLLYKTSSEFLKFFGLNRLFDLPRMDEIEEMIRQAEGPREQTVLPFGDDNGNGHRDASLLLLNSLPGETVVISAEAIIGAVSNVAALDDQFSDDHDEDDDFDDDIDDVNDSPVDEVSTDEPGLDKVIVESRLFGADVDHNSLDTPAPVLPPESGDITGTLTDEPSPDDDETVTENDGVSIPAMSFRRSSPDEAFEDAGSGDDEQAEGDLDEVPEAHEADSVYEPLPDIPAPVQYVTPGETDDDETGEDWSQTEATPDRDERQ